MIGTKLSTKILLSIAIGFIATFYMDVFSITLNKLSIIGNVITENELGRYFTGWLRGEFVYSSLSEMKPIPFEAALGILYHYLIGAFLAVVMILIFNKMMFSKTY